MYHLLLGINPKYIADAPYTPGVNSSLSLRAKELELNLSPSGGIYLLPNIAGFVGSDTVGVILATGMHREAKLRLAIDIGTNGEVALGSKGRLLVCSTAAGPAFEGASISCGMRAADGAIEGLTIGDQGIKYKVIGEKAKVLGICGSGLIQGIAEMLRNGILDSRGKLLSPSEATEKLSPALATRLRTLPVGYAFVLVEEDYQSGQQAIFISQKDIRELQLAKGAIAAGIRILMKEMGVELNNIEEVLLAGAFGSYIDQNSARMLGLIPPVPLSRVKSVGNAAGMGSRLALLSLNIRREAKEVAVMAQNIELSTRPDFQDAFVDSMGFPSLEDLSEK